MTQDLCSDIALQQSPQVLWLEIDYKKYAFRPTSNLIIPHENLSFQE